MFYEGLDLIVTPQERQEYIDTSVPDSKRQNHEIYNFSLNIISFAIAFHFFHFNLIGLTISFIVCDIVLGFLDNLIFNIKPQIHNYKMKDILYAQKYVESLEKKLKKYEPKYQKCLSEYCRNCRHSYYQNDSCYHPRYLKCSIVTKYEYTKNLYVEEKKALDKRLKEIEEENLKKEKKISSDFQNKLDYFDTLKKRYTYFVETENMTYLEKIINELSLLVDNLNNKPEALKIIPNTLYIYLDELQTIVDKIISLPEEKKNEYVKDIEKISNALSENIKYTTKRILNYQVEDIEVGINVLLSELIKENEKNEEDNDV